MMWTFGSWEAPRCYSCHLPPSLPRPHFSMDGGLPPSSPCLLRSIPSVTCIPLSACPGSCCPAESQENIGREASFRGTRSGGSWPQGSAVCRSSRSGSICARVRSRVNLRHARRGLFFLYRGPTPSQELQPAG